MSCYYQLLQLVFTLPWEASLRGVVEFCGKDGKLHSHYLQNDNTFNCTQDPRREVH